jgi:hypothetical protein
MMTVLSSCNAVIDKPWLFFPTISMTYLGARVPGSTGTRSHVIDPSAGRS